jgi:hypothetical protein
MLFVIVISCRVVATLGKLIFTCRDYQTFARPAWARE